jgi:hypothetical protein
MSQDQALETLRNELDVWRGRAAASQSACKVWLDVYIHVCIHVHVCIPCTYLIDKWSHACMRVQLGRSVCLCTCMHTHDEYIDTCVHVHGTGSERARSMVYSEIRKYALACTHVRVS